METRSSDLIKLSRELTSRSGISKFAIDVFVSFTKLSMCDRSGVAENCCQQKI